MTIRFENERDLKIGLKLFEEAAILLIKISKIFPHQDAKIQREIKSLIRHIHTNVDIEYPPFKWRTGMTNANQRRRKKTKT